MEKVLTEVKQSIPASAARWIYKNLSRGRNGPLFDDVLVLTPTKEGARSLGAELLEMALNDGRPGVSGIRSITLETFLAELIGGSTNIASAPQKLLAWLYALKNSAAQELFPNGGPKGEPPIETAAELDALMRRSLSPLEYKVMSMYVDGATMREMCLALGKNYKSVDNAISRSKSKLQRIMGG